jgi:predicted transcriptional regulator
MRSDDDAVLAEAGERFKRLWTTGKAAAAVFTFNSPAQLFSVISPKRWQLIERLQYVGATSIRGLARSLGRDVKRVRDDVTAMIEWGLMKRTQAGLVHVLDETIPAEFELRSVA